MHAAALFLVLLLRDKDPHPRVPRCAFFAPTYSPSLLELEYTFVRREETTGRNRALNCPKG